MVNGTRAAVVVLALGVLVIAFYDVDMHFEFALPHDETRADPRIEAQYARCFEAKDRAIHETAFGTIDNPDVQKEFIASRRVQASLECRALHPPATVTVTEPFRFRLFSLRPRYW